MKKKLKATLYGTIAFVLASYVIVIAGNGYSWLTDKDHILAKQESAGYFLLLTDGDTYPDSDRIVLVSEKFFHHHKIGDSIRVTTLPELNGSKARLQCRDFGCK